jgi:hypothetical protein
LYVEAKTEAVLGGRSALGEALRYLVDVPLDAKGKAPKFSKRSVILFARPVGDRTGELQLVAPDAQLLWDPALESRTKGILAELYAPGAPQGVIGLREAIHVPGALAGEGETQFFLATTSGDPAAISVSRVANHAGQRLFPNWSRLAIRRPRARHWPGIAWPAFFPRSFQAERTSPLRPKVDKWPRMTTAL